MWEKTCSEHEEKLDRVAMVSEYFSNAAATSVTRSASCHLVSDDSKRASSWNNDYFNEFNKLEVPFNISTHFTRYFDKMTSLAYLFGIEVCSSRWSSLYFKLSREAIDVLEDESPTMDTRGNVIELVDKKDCVLLFGNRFNPSELLSYITLLDQMVSFIKWERPLHQYIHMSKRAMALCSQQRVRLSSISSSKVFYGTLAEKWARHRRRRCKVRCFKQRLNTPLLVTVSVWLVGKFQALSRMYKRCILLCFRL